MALPCRIHHSSLEYVSFGKPNPFVFKNAEAILSELQPFCHDDHLINNGDSGAQPFKTLYMIGDNPFVDIKGAQQVCLLTRGACRPFLLYSNFNMFLLASPKHYYFCNRLRVQTSKTFGITGRRSLVFYFDEDRRV